MDAPEEQQVAPIVWAERELVERNAMVDRGGVAKIRSPIRRADCHQMCGGVVGAVDGNDTLG